MDKAQMIMLFPLSLSGAAQRWFASFDPSRRTTWADLGQKFIRQYFFNTEWTYPGGSWRPSGRG